MPLTTPLSGRRAAPDRRAAARTGLLILGSWAAFLPIVAAAAAPQEPESCRAVRISDIGWTAESVGTAVFARILSDLGYKPQVTVLSVHTAIRCAFRVTRGSPCPQLGSGMPFVFGCCPRQGVRLQLQAGGFAL